MRMTAVLGAFVALSACGEGTEPRPPISDTGTPDVAGGGDDAGACGLPRIACGGACVDVLSDDDHCGTCGAACGAHASCDDGTCVCDEPYTLCGGACVDTGASAEHCGRCGAACGAGEVCAAGTCAVDCPLGLVACAGACVDTRASEDHCGACGVPCAGALSQRAECAGGACVISCVEGSYDLDGRPGCEYACAPEQPRDDDVCDGEDNDCDGLTDARDPGYRPIACPLQSGVCSGAVAACVEGALVACTGETYAAAAGALPYDAELETWCDGVDNDCSGAADETCCTPADLPIAAASAPIPEGWDAWAESVILPVRGAPSPVAISVALARVGESERYLTNLASWPTAGGAAREVALRNTELTLSANPRPLAALYAGGVVTYVALPGGAIERAVYALDGARLESGSVALDDVAGGVAFDLRAEALDAATELLLVAASATGDNALAWPLVAEVSGGVITRASGQFTTDADNLTLLGATRAGELTIACVDIPSAAPDRVACVTLDRSLRFLRQQSFAGLPPLLAAPRFERRGDGTQVLYVSGGAGQEVNRVVVDAEGLVSFERLGLRTDQAVVVSGPMPSGEIGVLTAVHIEGGDGDDVLVSLVLPDRSAATIATYRGDLALPQAFVAAPEATYVAIAADGLAGVLRRSKAYRLSRDGAALCLER